MRLGDTLQLLLSVLLGTLSSSSTVASPFSEQVLSKLAPGEWSYWRHNGPEVGSPHQCNTTMIQPPDTSCTMPRRSSSWTSTPRTKSTCCPSSLDVFALCFCAASSPDMSAHVFYPTVTPYSCGASLVVHEFTNSACSSSNNNVSTARRPQPHHTKHC